MTLSLRGEDGDAVVGGGHDPGPVPDGAQHAGRDEGEDLGHGPRQEQRDDHGR
ncbi:MAG: hypothetical protein LH603_01285 [Pseudonocardia sp.]|nr:hypothetical protein [Pseudonocardia sp.]